MVLSGIGPTNCVLDLLLFVQWPTSQPLAQVKNGDRQFWKKRFHAANGKAQHALVVGPCFFFWGVGWRGVSYYYYFFLGQMGRLEEKIVAVLLYWLHSFSFGLFNVFRWDFCTLAITTILCWTVGLFSFHSFALFNVFPNNPTKAGHKEEREPLRIVVITRAQKSHLTWFLFLAGF